MHDLTVPVDGLVIKVKYSVILLNNGEKKVRVSNKPEKLFPN